MREKENHLPSYWEQIEELMSIFQSFKEVSLHLQRDSYGSLSLAIRCFRYLNFKADQLVIHDEWQTPLFVFKTAINYKWGKYFMQYHRVLLLATLPNPSHKGLSLSNEEIEEVDHHILSSLNQNLNYNIQTTNVR